MRKSASVSYLRNAFSSALSAASGLLVLVLAGCGTDAPAAGAARAAHSGPDS
jgi:hypothetical protein